jgi:hypothetical protein
MSDPNDNGQRNPLSSSSSHASGTSARSVSGQPNQAPGKTAAAQDDAAPVTPVSGGEAVAQADAQQHAEAGHKTEISHAAAGESSDDLAASATEQQDPAYEPDAVAEFEPSPAPVAESYTGYSEPAAEHHAEDADERAADPEDQPLIAASIGSTSEAVGEVSASATDEPDDTADEDAAPADPLPSETIPEAASVLGAVARQTIAENQARQEKAMALFDQVSRRFTMALEEAGVDAARVTFKVMEFAQASLKNNLELAKSYTAARSVPDIFGLHAAYLTRQFELLNAQAEELRELTAKFAMRSTASLKPQADQTANTLDNR